MEKYLEKVPFENLVNDFFSFYIKSFGQIEFEEVESRIKSSTKSKDFFMQSVNLNAKPSSIDILSVIHSILYFAFAKPEKISLAGIILLNKWTKIIATPFGLFDNIHLNTTFFNIIHKCNSFKFRVSGRENFFEKFISQSNSKYANYEATYKPPNIFSEIAYDSFLAHFIEHKLPKMGIFNCFIFYSTYISLLTSYVKISNTDNVDLNLAEGINSLFDFLELDEDDFYDFNDLDSIFDREFVGGYVQDLSGFYTNEIQKLLKNEDLFFDSSNESEFALLFNVNKPTDITELVNRDGFSLKKHKKLINTNINIINAKYDLLLSSANTLYLDEWKKNSSFNYIDSDSFFDELVIYPFYTSRCYICGNLTLREELKLVSYFYDEGRILPMCNSCRKKYNDSIDLI